MYVDNKYTKLFGYYQKKLAKLEILAIYSN